MTTLYIVYEAGTYSMQQFAAFDNAEEAIKCAKRLRTKQQGTIYVSQQTSEIIFNSESEELIILDERNSRNGNTYAAFLLAYADCERDAALYIWDCHHRSWSERNREVANVIVAQLDSPTPRLMTATEWEKWHQEWANKSREIADKYIAQVCGMERSV